MTVTNPYIGLGLKRIRFTHFVEIIKVVCDYCKTTPNELQKKCRKKELVFARQLSTYLIRKYTFTNQQEIANFFNQKDHTSVVNSMVKFRGYIKNNDELVTSSVSEVENILTKKGYFLEVVPSFYKNKIAKVNRGKQSNDSRKYSRKYN